MHEPLFPIMILTDPETEKGVVVQKLAETESGKILSYLTSDGVVKVQLLAEGKATLLDLHPESVKDSGIAGSLPQRPYYQVLDKETNQLGMYFNSSFVVFPDPYCRARVVEGEDDVNDLDLCMVETSASFNHAMVQSLINKPLADLADLFGFK